MTGEHHAQLHDQERLAALQQLGLLDAPTDPVFERLGRLAARLLQAPVALVSLVDAERQFFASCIGLPAPWSTLRQTPLSHSFCQYPVASGQPFMVNDARDHPLVRDNLAIPDLGVIAYLGIPLATPSGALVGALCVIDHVPRVWEPEDVALLTDIAALVMDEFARRSVLQAQQQQQAIALRDAERRFAALVHSAQDAIIILDRTLRVVHWNKGAETIFGYTVAEMQAEPLAKLLVPEERPHYTHALASLHDTAEQAAVDRTVTLHGCSKDGRDCVLELALSMWEAVDGVYYGVIMRDITQRVQLEAQMLHAQKMESIGRLAGGIAHDFNNLLTAMLGYAEIGEEELWEGHPVALYFREIRQTGRRAAQVIRQLLMFARKQSFEPRPIHLNDLLVDIDSLLRRLIGSQVELVTVLAPHLAWVRGDPGQLEQVIVNLVVNARDALPVGGKVILTTGMEVVERQHRHAPELIPGRYVQLTVQDTGIGMDDAVKHQLFEPFFTTKAANQGTGLGLATSYGIIKQHGGAITVESSPGHGTTFTIFLPQHNQNAAAAPVASQLVHKHVQGRETILLVEDEVTVRTLSAHVLRAQGYTVIEAIHGAEAIHLVQTQPDLSVQVVLTDMMMPQMNGVTLIETLRLNRPGIKCVLMSGYIDLQLKDHYLGDHGIVFLSKPFTMAQLLHTIRDVFDKQS